MPPACASKISTKNYRFLFCSLLGQIKLRKMILVMWWSPPPCWHSPGYKRFAPERRCCSTSPRSSARLSSVRARKWWHFFKWRHFSHWDSSHPLLEQRCCLMWDDNVRILQIIIFQALLIFMVSPAFLSLPILSFEHMDPWTSLYILKNDLGQFKGMLANLRGRKDGASHRQHSARVQLVTPWVFPESNHSPELPPLTIFAHSSELAPVRFSGISCQVPQMLGFPWIRACFVIFLLVVYLPCFAGILSGLPTQGSFNITNPTEASFTSVDNFLRFKALLLFL